MVQVCNLCPALEFKMDPGVRTLVLKFRGQSQFSQCDVCQELKGQRLCCYMFFKDFLYKYLYIGW